MDGCERDAAAKGYCHLHYKRWRRHGDPTVAQRMVPRGSSLVDRLAILTDSSGGPDACWPWTGTIHHTGYGVMQFQGRLRSAHVWAFVAVHGEPPPEQPHVLHSCDNPPCCNPAHLRAGTNQDNMDDKVRRGRQARQPGEAAPARKLTADDARAILAARGAARAVDLASQYGVSKSAIYLIWNRQTWSHLT